jgi:hypothetical protein
MELVTMLFFQENKPLEEVKHDKNKVPERLND